MIVGELNTVEIRRATQSLPALQHGFEFLQRQGLASLEDGRHDIDGDDLFAIVAREHGRGQAASPLEYHRKFVDIQYVIAGVDLIGWLPTNCCQRKRGEFDEGKDLGFFHDRPATWLNIQPGTFAVFFPEDAHAPLASNVPIHKVVVKARLAGT
ncbi:MAG: YhcH/YjgK/YiaL family protein [Planctomycetales bacterium]|nr:YhcH/YjgK/YiaL family protein [Planctomycetales bacterium]